MNTKLIIGISTLLFITSVYAQFDEDLYCIRYGIEDWCSKQGADFLESLTPTDLADFTYINDLAFSDAIRYTGELQITSIDVKADLNDPSQVEATYMLINSGASDLTVHIVAWESPIDSELYENGVLLNTDPLLDGWNFTFAPGEEKEVVLKYSEPIYDNMFGFNVNLLFDSKTVDNHITPTGSFEFTLPENAIANCVPESYTTSTVNGRTVITWQKTDFIPWTNPFNDLICKWIIVEPETEPVPVQQGDNTLLIILLIVAVLVALIYLKKTGRLERN